MKKFYVHIRTAIKFISLVFLACIIIVGIIMLTYKPIYSVSLDGEQIGYSEDKSKLQKRINDYMEKGEGENVAFVQIDEMPEYKLCLLKKGIVTNDEEIYKLITEDGITYYNYYAITEDSKEKLYVSTFEEAEDIINSLKEKKSSNASKLAIVEKYETEKKEFTTSEKAIADLYVKPVVTVAKKTSSGGYVNTSTKISNAKVNLGINLIKPISGTISSRYGSRWGATHTGLDIATSAGTPIKAAAGGTVTYAGWKGSYGNLVVVSHGNGVQTYYAHCSSILVSAGQSVSQGQTIAKVGSTGNSTGPHLHLEIRKNGTSLNPQNYLY